MNSKILRVAAILLFGILALILSFYFISDLSRKAEVLIGKNYLSFYTEIDNGRIVLRMKNRSNERIYVMPPSSWGWEILSPTSVIKDVGFVVDPPERMYRYNALIVLDAHSVVPDHLSSSPQVDFDLGPLPESAKSGDLIRLTAGFQSHKSFPILSESTETHEIKIDVPVP